VLHKTISTALYGVDANLTEVEVDITPIKGQGPAMPAWACPTLLCSESRERGRSTLKNSGYDIPPSNTAINLTLSDLPCPSPSPRANKNPQADPA